MIKIKNRHIFNIGVEIIHIFKNYNEESDEGYFLEVEF